MTATSRLELRLPAEAKARIERAAALSGTSGASTPRRVELRSPRGLGRSARRLRRLPVRVLVDTPGAAVG